MNLKNYIATTKEKVELTIELFYQHKIQEGYQELIQVIDCLLQIIIYMQDNKTNVELLEKINELQYSLNCITEAIINNDIVLQADILNYEVNDILDAMVEIIQ